MGEKIRIWIPSILLGLTIGIQIALDVFNTNIRVAFGLVILLLVIQIIILQKEIVDIKTKKPNVVVDGFKMEPPFHLKRGGVHKEILERYYIMFRNKKPKGKSNIDTKPVHVIMTYYNSDKERLDHLSHEKPFWLDLSGPPWERSENFEVILKASSKPEGLCLVVREQGGSDLFGFSDMSYIADVRSLEPFQDKLRIASQQFFIKIELISENIEMAPIWVSVTNRSERERPLFEVIEVPGNLI